MGKTDKQAKSKVVTIKKKRQHPAKVVSEAGKQKKNPYLRRQVKLDKILFSGTIRKLVNEIGGITGVTREYRELLSKCAVHYVLAIRNETVSILENSGRVIVKPLHVALATQSLAARKSPENFVNQIEPLGRVWQRYQEIDHSLTADDQ